MAGNPARSQTTPCSSNGARLEISVGPALDGLPLAGLLVGTLVTASCDPGASNLNVGYAVPVRCDPAAPEACSTVVTALTPGEWVHRVFVARTGQFQARRGLLLDASAGTNSLQWPLFRSVFTVTSTADAGSCSGCLRDAIEHAESAAKPALVQFEAPLTGTITLASALPELGTGSVTIDGLDTDGVPLKRTIDVNGLKSAAVAIRSADNTVVGLRITNVGGNSDAMVIEGTGADNNRLEQLQVIGRGLQTCGADNEGCIVDGACHTMSTDPPFGACGDDGIAVRDNAGIGRPNVVHNCEVMGAFDKGVKVSEFAVVRVEQSRIHDNRDGGMQATFSGQLITAENIVENNQVTNSANGLAANGPLEDSTVPARVTSSGDIVRGNSLRGVSVRSLSVVEVLDSFICGNGRIDRGGFGITIFDGANLSALAVGSGLAVVYNAGGGVRVEDTSQADFGGFLSHGNNAFAFNGASPGALQVNFQNLAPFAATAVNNQWQHCGRGWSCDRAQIEAADLFRGADAGALPISPSQPNHRRQPPSIKRIEPPVAQAGDIVRIYGSGFDAIDGNGPGATCDSLATVNTCTPLRGNCVFFDRQPAQVVAVTPTMIAVLAPFTCVSPVPVSVRTRYSRGAGHGTFCALPPQKTARSFDMP